MTQVHTRAVHGTAQQTGNLPLATSTRLPSRQHPRTHRVSTPATLRYAQISIAVAGLLIGLLSIPLMMASQQYARQSTSEQANADLSAIQSEVAQANEIALRSMITGSPDAPGFQAQMGTVAHNVASAGRSGVTDSSLLGAVNAGLIQYTAEVNTALAAEAVAPGTGVADMRAAQTTLNDDVWTNLNTLLSSSADTNASATWPMGLAWAALFLGGAVVVWWLIVVARRSRRVVNLGLLGALVVLVLGGTAIAMMTSAVQGPTQATTAHTLTAAEGQLAQARASELSYILDPSSEAKTKVDTHLQQARQLLAEGAPRSAFLSDYESAWKDVEKAVSDSDRAAAVDVATTRSGPAVDRAMRSMTSLIDTNRTDVDSTLSSGTPALLWMGISMIVAGLGCLICGITGVHARMREYR